MSRLSGKPDQVLQKGIYFLTQNFPREPHRLCLKGQPFDSHLLHLSSLFQKSRRLFLKTGGRFEASFVSSPRTLGSPHLLDPVIEYSPIEKEMVWAVNDPVQRKTTHYIQTLRTYSTSVYHEQNHRILWKLLPPPPANPKDLHSYLNLVESWVIAADMALGDELSSSVAPLFHLSGVTYDPGTEIKSEGLNQRAYRNFLHAATYATYLNLELYSAQDIKKIIRALYGELTPFADRAVERSLKLDRQFVERTNPVWQKRHSHTVYEKLGNSTQSGFQVARNPLDNRVAYLWTENWFNLLKI